MKKIKFIVLISLGIGLLCLCVFFILKDERNKPEERTRQSQDWAPGEYEIYLAKEKKPVDIIWCGKNPQYDEGWATAPIRYEDTIDEKVLKKRDGAKNVLIVVDDSAGNAKLTEVEYRMIFERIHKDNTYGFVYIGMQQADLLTKLGFLSSVDQISDESFSFVFWFDGFKEHLVFGGCTRKDIEDGLGTVQVALLWYEDWVDGIRAEYK